MNNAAIDINEFEMAIRADERAKILREKRERKLAIMKEKRERLYILKQYAIQRARWAPSTLSSVPQAYP